jgi:hypothetical protein
LVLTPSHFNAALLFSIFASTVFAITQRTTTREMFRYGLYCFSLFMGFEHYLPRNSVWPRFSMESCPRMDIEGLFTHLSEIVKQGQVEITISLADGGIVSATMDNPIAVIARECSDSKLMQCGEPEHYQIRRQIELQVMPLP